jgi:hypothetical protein
MFAKLANRRTHQAAPPRRAAEFHAPQKLDRPTGQPLEPLNGGAGLGDLVVAAGTHEEGSDERHDGVRDASAERRPRQPLPGRLVLQRTQLPPVQRGVAVVGGAPQLPAPAEQGHVRGLPPAGDVERGLHLDVRHLQPLDAFPCRQPLLVLADDEGGGPVDHLADDHRSDNLGHLRRLWRIGGATVGRQSRMCNGERCLREFRSDEDTEKMRLLQTWHAGHWSEKLLVNTMELTFQKLNGTGRKM